MMSFVEWCNYNSGFISALLSLMTIVISVIAVIISIKMARLPFKKKLELNGTVGLAVGDGIIEPVVSGYYVSLCNTGNRIVHIKFLGLAIEKNARKNEFDLFHNLQCGNASGEKLSPSEVIEVQYSADKLISALQKIERSRMIYYYASDTEGDIVKKKYASVGNLLSQFGL